MRINLAAPYADKDKVKSLGARWDATRKLWYIVDVADLTPFMAWIPDLVAASNDGPKQTSKPSAPRIVTKPAQALPGRGCDCQVLPWEDCIHSAVQR
jgi:hypothetical protein